ncbi:MAG: transketolase family protein [Candidatus Aminicenantes bacterium]|jgi:transketolase|nr:transketolase family protein [Candidatus Aminicenantes bacterium]
MAKESLRGEYGKTLLRIGRDNKNIVVLDADLAKSTKTLTFGKEVAERFIDMGLSEQDMISTAAGISLTGKTVFASTFCVFLIGRVYDQVRQSVCYNNANVKLVGTHSGLGVGEDGATHQMLEDIALLRPLPNMRVIVPADATETARAVEYAAENDGPFFIRLTRGNLEKIYDSNYKFELGRASVIKPGRDITLFAIGAMVEKALEAAKVLAQESIDAAVINVSTVKPLDKDTIMDAARKTRAVITIEDHSVYGGLGSAIAEFLSQNHPTKMKIIGVEGVFGRSGSAADLYSHFKLTAHRVVDEARKLIS